MRSNAHYSSRHVLFFSIFGLNMARLVAFVPQGKVVRHKEIVRFATAHEEDGIVLGSKYVLMSEGAQSTSGKSTLVEATPKQAQTAPATATTSNHGFHSNNWQDYWANYNPLSGSNCNPYANQQQAAQPEQTQPVAGEERKRVVVKFSENIGALEREVYNYRRVASNEETKDLFVQIHDFYNPSQNNRNAPGSNGENTPQFKGQAALVMERGDQDLESYIRENGALQGNTLRKLVATTGRTVQAFHDMGKVWTELKSANFVMSSADVTAIKAIDLESAVRQGNPPIDFTPAAIPPEFALAYLCGREAITEIYFSFDIFSLGLMWYEMAMGRSFWQEYFGQEVPDNAEIVNTLRTFQGQVPIENAPIEEPLKEIIGYCLKVNPQERPTIHDLMNHPYIAEMMRA